MILITGASGAIGYELSLLLSGRDDVRVLAHSDSSAERLARLGLDVARGNLADPETAASAFEGIERLFLLTPFALEQDQLEANALELAQRAGVERIVKLSVEFADDDEPIAVAAPHHASERRLAASGLPVCLLRPTSYASNLLQDLEELRAGVISYPAGEARLAHIDPRDVADAAATALLAEEPITGVFELRGPQAFTHGELAELIGGVTYVDPPAQQWMEAAVAAGVPRFYAEALAELYTRYREGPSDPHANDFERLTGRRPRALAAYVEERVRPALGQAVAA